MMVDINVIVKGAVAPSHIRSRRFGHYPRGESVEEIQPRIRQAPDANLLGDHFKALSGKEREIPLQAYRSQQLRNCVLPTNRRRIYGSNIVDGAHLAQRL